MSKIKKISEKKLIKNLREAIEYKDSELKEKDRQIKTLSEKLDALDNMVIGRQYGDFYIRSDRDTIFERIAKIIAENASTQNANSNLVSENRRLWHMVRSLTGDKTLELPRQKIYKTTPDGTQIIKTDGDYDQRFYPF